ncbi:Rha family transcriptional regulator [Lachnospiraceae bacterium 46-15]
MCCLRCNGKYSISFSKIIAEGTNNQHHTVRELIKKYKSDIEEFGTLSILNEESTGGRPMEVFLLNEEQATFVITLLRNSKVVVKFKKELVRQFYAMRRFLIEKQSKIWNDTRLASKENRLKETDVIKLLVEYAKDQGGAHSNKLYVVYTKLANSIVGGKRDDMTASELNTHTLVESIIKQTIEIDMSMGMHYKDIYKDCKERIKQFGEITYLSA